MVPLIAAEVRAHEQQRETGTGKVGQGRTSYSVLRAL